MPKPNLLPCPHCPNGGKPKMETMRFHHTKLPPLVRVYCEKCGCGTSWKRTDYGDSVADWNRRAPAEKEGAAHG